MTLPPARTSGLRTALILVGGLACGIVFQAFVGLLGFGLILLALDPAAGSTTAAPPSATAVAKTPAPSLPSPVPATPSGETATPLGKTATSTAPTAGPPATSTSPRRSTEPTSRTSSSRPAGPTATSAKPRHEASSARPTRTASAAPHAKAGTALAVVAGLTVKGRAPKTGYDRAQFGQRWKDIDHNGCDQRNDILRRDFAAFVTRAGSRGCVVISGTFHDPYTGKTIHFVRGQGTSNAVQIDHVIALSDAWQKGAQQWSAAKRERFGNDPLNLLAADGPANESKGDGDTATWLPPNKAFRCAYVARQVAVTKTYGLWVTKAEQAAMTRVLSSCPNQKLPTEASSAIPPRRSSTDAADPKPQPKPTATIKPKPKATTQPPSGGDVYYKNCTAVRAAGKAPLHRGDPGYSRKLDRDGDGVACE